MPEKCLRPPVGEPVTLTEAKLHLRVTDDSQDALISMLISAARIACETKTRQQLLHATWQLVFDRFPMAGMGTPLPFSRDVNIPGFAAILPHAPYVAMEQITYLDMNGDLQTVDPSTYVVNEAMTPAIVALAFGQIWPIPLPQIGAVRFSYTAGYASPATFTAGQPTFSVNSPCTWGVGEQVTFSNSGGALPAELQPNTPYLIASAAPTAAAGTYSVTDLDGNAITFADTDSGQSFLGTVPAGLRNWILLRVGSLYENREEVAILNRGKVEELPFVDGLLDPYVVSLP